MSDNVVTYTDWSDIAEEKFNKNEQNKLNRQYVEQAACENSIECNLGLHDYKNHIYTSSYVGVTRLVDNNGNVIKNKDGKDIVLAVEPRFNVDVWKMFDTVLGDDEYNDYESSQSDNSGSLLYDIFLDQKPIKIKTNSQQSGNLLLAISFIRQCKNICMKQLKSRDVYTDENLNGKIKGRILFNQHLKKNVFQGREDRIFCRYKVTTVDCIENRILKAALLKAKKIIDNEHTVQIPNIKSMWRYCMTALDDVRTVNITSADFSAAKTTGYYSFYKPAFSLAKLIIKDSSIDISQSEEKEHYIVPYAIKMESLFEFYCRAVIKKKIKEYNKDNDDKIRILKYQKYEPNKPDEKCLYLLSSGEKGTHLQKTFIPDIVLCKGDDICVYDAKYKDKDNSKKYKYIVRQDSFQILSYALLLNAVSCGFIMPEPKPKNDNSNEKKNTNKDTNAKTEFELDFPELDEFFPTEPKNQNSQFIASYQHDSDTDDVYFSVKDNNLFSHIQFKTFILKEKPKNQT